jgi:hypothetical protein
MAVSITINAKFWDDPRFLDLKAEISEQKATWACVTAWRIAHGFWQDGQRPIPFKIWKALKLPQAMIQVGLAKELETGIYVLGTSEQCEKYNRRVAAARTGGEKSAEKRNAIKPNYIAETTQPAVQAELNGCSTDAQASVFVSVFESKKEKNNTTERAAARTGAITEFLGNSHIEEFLQKVSVSAQTAWVAVYEDPEWIKQEILKAVAWCKSNQRKAPKSNYSSFMARWLARSWEQYRKSIPPTKTNAYLSLDTETE